MAKTAVAAVVALVGAAFTVGWFASAARDVEPSPVPEKAAPRREPPTTARRSDSSEIAELRRVLAQTQSALAEAQKRSEPPRPDAAEILAKRTNETLDPATRTAVQDRADRLRKSLLAQADAAEATVAAQVERESAAERAEREDRMRGGTMSFLQGLERSWTPQSELVRSPDQFGALFERRSHGGVVDGATLAYDAPPLDGTTIRFTAGRFALDVRRMSAWRPFPKDLVLEGAGMDASLLVLNDRFRIGDPVHAFTLRDITIDASQSHFADLDGAYTLRLERCRVVGFDDGAGGSSMLDGYPGAFLATDCRFEAGFGRTLHGNLFDVRGAFLARLENCVIVGPFDSVYERSSSTTQIFSHCRFARMNADRKSQYEQPPSVVELQECTFEYLTPEEARTTPTHRPLSDINPAWAVAKKR